MIYRLYEMPPWIIGAAITIVLLLSMQLGAWYGGRHARRADEAGHSQTRRSDLEVGALLALMGLVLAFTYSFSLSRLDLRKQALIHEVNAIETAFLRASLLPEPGRTELRERLLEYGKTRILSKDAQRNIVHLEAALEATMTAQAKLWPALENTLAGVPPSHLHMLMVPAVNDVLDAHTTRLAVGTDRFAPSVLLFLVVVTSLAVGFAAQNSAQEGTLNRWRVATFALVLSLLIFIIVDFDNSSRGIVQIDQSSLKNMVAEMEAAMSR